MNVSKQPELEGRIRQVLVRALNVSPQEAAGDLRMGAHPRWDSLGHMGLVLELEREFNVSFPAYDLAELTSVETIARAIERLQQEGR